jgi:MOSC domain-containing protein YiiM
MTLLDVQNVVFSGPLVVAVSAVKKHGFSKATTNNITLLAGLGVAGDAHCGAYVQHLYDKARNPARPNLRQVHLIEQELLDQLKQDGYAVGPGQLGENITTHYLNLLELEVGTVLKLGETAQVRITGLREPCVKIDRFQRGLQKAVTARRDGYTCMKGAVMRIVIDSRTVSVGDIIHITASASGLDSPLRPV